jgi:hypothetical protein
MTVRERAEAIARFQDHEAEALGRQAKRERHRREDLATWSSAVLTISQSVQDVSVDFAARGSLFLFSPIPVQMEGGAIYRVKTTEGVRLFAKLQFDLTDGEVIASTTVAGTHLPLSLPLMELSSEWVEMAAEEVLIAVLKAA